MIQIYIKLYGALRDKLPTEAKGSTVLALPASATIRDVLEQLAITQNVLVAVGESQKVNHDHRLEDGDRVTIFLPVSGGLI